MKSGDFKGVPALKKRPGVDFFLRQLEVDRLTNINHTLLLLTELPDCNENHDFFFLTAFPIWLGQ